MIVVGKMTVLRLCQSHINRERDVGQTDHPENKVPVELNTTLMLLRDSKRRSQRELGPSETRVRHEDEHGHDVETAPNGILQDLELIQVDVSDGYRRNTLVVGPEERQGDQPTGPPVDERRWRSQEILLSICKAELEEVNGHECEQHQTRDGQIQLAAHQPRGQLLIPSSLQTHEDVQQSAQQHILLDNVGLKSEACPIQTDVEVTVAVEIVRSLEHMKISDRVHNDEKDQKHGEGTYTWKDRSVEKGYWENGKFTGQS